MMLVDADRIESHLIGEFDLGEIALVKLVTYLGIEVRIGQGDPRRFVLVGVIEVQVRIRHQVEEHEFHRAAPRSSRKAVTAARNSSGFSICGRWPHWGMIVVRVSGISRANSAA